MLPMAFGGSPMDWGIIALIVILLFGVKKLPEIGKSMAEGIYEFKKAARKAAEEDTKPEKTDGAEKSE